MLSIQVIQAVLKDQRMREQAHLIQGEVIRMMEDVSRLDERVRKLQGHFALTQRDIEQILTSTDKVAKRGQRIEALEFGPERDGAEGTLPATESGSSSTGSAAASKTGQLRLRVVEDEG
jgi:DNA recombination protein RmuC